MPQKTPLGSISGDLEGLFDDEDPIKKQSDEPGKDADTDDSKAQKADDVSKTPTTPTEPEEGYEKSVQKMLVDGKVVEKEYYHKGDVFVGYVEDIDKVVTKEPEMETEAIQALLKAFEKVSNILKQHDKRLSDIAELAKSAKDSANRTVLVDARKMDDELTILDKSGKKDKEPENDIWAGLLPNLTALEQPAEVEE